MNKVSYRKVYGYIFLPLNFNEAFKIIKKMSFYCLNLPQTHKMIRNNKFTIIISLVILYLSLASASTFERFSKLEALPYADKFVHFGLYFAFTAILIFEHRNLFKDTRQLLLSALIPFFFGALMEFLQTDITTTRSGDVFDLLADSVGIAGALYLWLIIKPFYKEKSK